MDGVNRSEHFSIKDTQTVFHVLYELQDFSRVLYFYGRGHGHNGAVLKIFDDFFESVLFHERVGVKTSDKFGFR